MDCYSSCNGCNEISVVDNKLLIHFTTFYDENSLGICFPPFYAFVLDSSFINTMGLYVFKIFLPLVYALYFLIG